jgi:four helix bundle protein
LSAGRGSLYEIIDHLIVAEEEKYISKEDLNNYKIEIEDCLAVLNGFINYLGRAKQNKVNEPELSYPNTDND